MLIKTWRTKIILKLECTYKFTIQYNIIFPLLFNSTYECRHVYLDTDVYCLSGNTLLILCCTRHSTSTVC